MALNTKGYVESRPYKVYEETITTGTNTHNFNEALGRNVRQGYVSCDGEGNILVRFKQTHDQDFGEQLTMKKGETINLEGLEVHTIEIAHSGTDSSYRVLGV